MSQPSCGYQQSCKMICQKEGGKAWNGIEKGFVPADGSKALDNALR
jgi:hypothetical protein